MKKVILLLFAILLFAFKIEDTKSEYLIPSFPISGTIADLNSDSSIDIVIGHMYSFSSAWGGYTILENNGSGIFNVSSQYLYGNHFNVFAEQIDSDNNYDLITQFTENGQSAIAVISNFDQSSDSIKIFSLAYFADFMAIGDVSGNGSKDIVFANNNNFIWGILYNEGTGNFSTPEYFGLTFPPIDIACADLNDDGRDDVIIAGEYSLIFFSYASGFEQQSLGYTWTTGCKVLISDFNNDNMKDILIVGGVEGPHTRIYMYKNTGNNQFQQMPNFEFDPLTQYAQTADFDNDSLPDIVFCAYDNSGLYIYNNIGNFQLELNQFLPIDNYGGTLRRALCAYFDNNLFNDIAVIRGTGINMPYNVEILFNDGQENFVENPITGIQNTKTNSIVKNPIRCYPNPFINETRISTTIDGNEIKNLEIYNLEGRLIKEFSESELYTGVYEFIWDGKDKDGKEVKTGLYFIRLKSGRKVFTQKVMKIK